MNKYCNYWFFEVSHLNVFLCQRYITRVRVSVICRRTETLNTVIIYSDGAEQSRDGTRSDSRWLMEPFSVGRRLSVRPLVRRTAAFPVSYVDMTPLCVLVDQSPGEVSKDRQKNSVNRDACRSRWWMLMGLKSLVLRLLLFQQLKRFWPLLKWVDLKLPVIYLALGYPSECKQG